MMPRSYPFTIAAVFTIFAKNDTKFAMKSFSEEISDKIYY